MDTAFDQHNATPQIRGAQSIPTGQQATAEKRCAMEIQTPTLLKEHYPTGYQEVLFWKVTENLSRVVFAQALALLSFFIFGILFTLVAVSLGKLPVTGS